MQGQAARPHTDAPPTAPPEEPNAPKVDGVFEVGDRVRIKGQTAKLWHVLTVDPERDSPGTIKIHPDCSCGGPTWVAPSMLLHDTYS